MGKKLLVLLLIILLQLPIQVQAAENAASSVRPASHEISAIRLSQEQDQGQKKIREDPEKALEENEKTEKSEPENITLSKRAAILLLCGTGTVIILLSAALITVLVVKRKKQPPKQKTAKKQNRGVYMELEIRSGAYPSGQTAFYLDQELLIGRDPSCDICFDDPDIAPKQARIYWEGSMIYVQNLGEKAGLILGGMRLFQPNRLRSGDELSVGSAVFSLRF